MGERGKSKVLDFLVPKRTPYFLEDFCRAPSKNASGKHVFLKKDPSVKSCKQKKELQRTLSFVVLAEVSFFGKKS